MTDMQSYPEPAETSAMMSRLPRLSLRRDYGGADRIECSAVCVAGLPTTLNIDPIAVRIITSYASMPRRRSRGRVGIVTPIGSR